MNEVYVTGTIDRIIFENPSTFYKYLKTLEDILSKKIGEKKAREKVISLLPSFTSILTISNEDFSIIREKIINEILKEKEK